MTKLQVRLTALLVPLAAVAVGAGGLAWACVPMPFMSVQPRASGPPGSEVTVIGASFPGPVDIRWNGHDGALLASAEGPDFSRMVKIPETPEGLYVVFGVARDPAGGVAATASAAFQVIGPRRPGPPDARQQEAGPGPASPSVPSSEGLGAGTLVPAGVLLLALGVLAGLLVARRRRRAPVGEAPAASPPRS
ncbi:MAG TPA: hypothetical protein VNA57_07535 [Acidimicrobiales bacterium]|nr:hypothetical protein [Acidimicrobiales bacterium]